MKSHFHEMSSCYLIIAVILVVKIALTEAFICPDQCSCIEIQRKRYSYNHAKCTSLDGLRQLGKTSDLHSLDLSSMNLTKITNQLDKLTNLSKLDLHDNLLSEIASLSTKRIRSLNLSNNRITSGKLSKIPIYVKHLNLSHNDITVLTDTFKRFVHLKSLELDNNPLNCTCETLDIRNWLQERHVWTDNPIKCMTPLQFKGRSWLQIRQSDVCDSNYLDEPRMLPLQEQNDDENDLMLGDDPNAGVKTDSVELSEELPEDADEEDDIDSDFLPVGLKNDKHKRTHDGSDELTNISDNHDYQDEGSGSEVVDAMPLINLNTASSTTLYEGSGDDIEESSKSIDLIDNEPISNETFSEDASDEASTETVLPLNLNVSDGSDSNENNTKLLLQPPVEPKSNEQDETQIPVTEETIVPVKSAPADAEFIESNNPDANTSKLSEEARIEHPVQESRSTYILLAILGVLLIVLILYVATKRSRSNGKNRRNHNDAETPAQELLNMDKNNLGKPIPTNTVEFIPLIPEKHATDKQNSLQNAEQPLLQKLSEAENENEDDASTNGNNDKQHIPTHQTNGNNNNNAQSIPNGVHTDKNGNEDNKRHISPKPSRYSPVITLDVIIYTHNNNQFHFLIF